MELVHTSAPRGLRSAARAGFCTVAATQGMPTDLMDRLESMSGFKQALDAADPRPRAVFSHVVLSVGGGPMHLLSRIGPAPANYSVEQTASPITCCCRKPSVPPPVP